MWNGIKHRARGEASFSVQDARSLRDPPETFDIVYSMSVIEHVEGASGDIESIREMVRVLKPRGLLLVTVPLGGRYVEQGRIGFQGAAHETGDQNRYFFQRIYSLEEIEKRIACAASRNAPRETISIQRKVGTLLHVYRHLGTNLRAAFDCFNPLLSAALNRDCAGVIPGTSE